MKKTYIQFRFNSAFISRHDGNEQFALYADVDAVYGGWLAETSGEPMCLNALEDAGCDGVIAEISRIISDPATPWEALSEEDTEYIRDTLAAWGIK